MTSEYLNANKESKATYCIHHINVSRRDFLSLLTRFLYLLHIPYTKGRPTKLSPHLYPTIIFRRSVSVGLSLDSANKWTRKVNFVGVRDGKLDYGTDFRMKRRWFLGLRWLPLQLLLMLLGLLLVLL
jgi:hypothetical protein